MVRLRYQVCLGVGVLCTFFFALPFFELTAKWNFSMFHSTSTSDPVESPLLYIVTKSYGGQMTRAIRNMMVQQCWAGSFRGNIVITEPFSLESQLVHTPQIWSEVGKGQLHTAARFSDYYDLTFYNEISVRYKLAKLISWEDFLSDAPRTAVSVSIPPHNCKSGVVKSEKCFYSKPFAALLSKLVAIGFNVSRKVCLRCSTIHQFHPLKELLLDGKGGLSVFVDSWRNFVFTKTWMNISDHCKLAESADSSGFLVPSSLVIKHSYFYIDTFIQKRHFVGIMLRIERFLTIAASGRSSENVESCLRETMSLFDKESSNKGGFVTVDIGKYGSGVMQEQVAVNRFAMGSIRFITSLVESLFKHVYNVTTTLEAWESTFTNATGGITERGYIAMVQRNIVAQADCLILMGGGSFQQIAGFHYLSNMKKKGVRPCMHTVCTTNNFRKLFNIEPT